MRNREWLEGSNSLRKVYQTDKEPHTIRFALMMPKTVVWYTRVSACAITATTSLEVPPMPGRTRCAARSTARANSNMVMETRFAGPALDFGKTKKGSEGFCLLRNARASGTVSDESIAMELVGRKTISCMGYLYQNNEVLPREKGTQKLVTRWH